MSTSELSPGQGRSQDFCLSRAKLWIQKIDQVGANLYGGCEGGLQGAKPLPVRWGFGGEAPENFFLIYIGIFW